MFWVGTPPIIRSTYNCNYSIWHWSNRLCYLPQSWSSWNCVPTLHYSYMCSWWWVEFPPKTCRAVYRNIINCILSHTVRQLLTLIHDARTHEHKILYTCTQCFWWQYRPDCGFLVCQIWTRTFWNSGAREYKNNPRTDDNLKNNIRDVVFQISTGQFRNAVNNLFVTLARVWTPNKTISKNLLQYGECNIS
jgi:hypothetical protein